MAVEHNTEELIQWIELFEAKINLFINATKDRPVKHDRLVSNLLQCTQMLSWFEASRRILRGEKFYDVYFDLDNARLKCDIHDKLIDSQKWLSVAAAVELVDVSDLAVFLTDLDDLIVEFTDERAYKEVSGEFVVGMLKVIRKDAIKYFGD